MHSCYLLRANIIVTINLWYPFILSHICKMTNMLLKTFNRFDIKRLIFLQCRTCFCQNKEKDVTKRYQGYTCLTSHNFLTFEPISKILFVFSFRYIALSNSCIRYQFGPANKNSFALLTLVISTGIGSTLHITNSAHNKLGPYKFGT